MNPSGGHVHKPAAVLLGLLASAGSVAGQDLPDYRDDRSGPEAVVQSLYNAIERKEWTRAWSYFREEAAPPFDAFEAGYADTRHVRLRLGTASSEGAAGSLFFSVPAVVEARTDEAVTVYAGCYELRLAQPGAQVVPPFRPLAVSGAKLSRVEASFETAEAACPGTVAQ